MKSYIAMAVLCMLASCAGTGTKRVKPIPKSQRTALSLS